MLQNQVSSFLQLRFFSVSFALAVLIGVAINTTTTPALAAMSAEENFAGAMAILNLNPGDEITIRANTTTTVTCAAGPSLPACKNVIASFESRYQTCKRSFPASTCFNNEWPAFKSRHPECVTEGFDACVRTCGESFPGSTCYNNCR